ncbi:nitroreductase family protein [Jannaschia seohaensis]|uniref:Nitroreductase n=1 Tax=Jannaschia seohaensis TaxID=475081 RepID=A0A2Y9AQW2_9RHOB|nr:nitroreductase family protein [Jannaschia seohaensis]PWJ18315.1 nitroreductase [Jannaschia seohaensis]SSA46840.1 Nitroreductase [Jannaschia seohaensis]
MARRQGMDVLERSETVTDAEMLARAEAVRDRLRTRRTVRDYAPTPVPRAVIEACVAAAGTAPSGANQQPWHFEAISDPVLKARIREAAEEEEKRFYGGGASQEWLDALGPLGTDWRKPHLTDAAWLIVVFAQRYGIGPDGARVKHYYVPESVGIASGMLIAALHEAGLATLTHTPNPMGFLRELLERPENEKAVMIVACGHAAPEAEVPKAAKVKKTLGEILVVRE